MKKLLVVLASIAAIACCVKISGALPLIVTIISTVTAVGMVRKYRDTFEYSVVGVSDNRVFKSVSDMIGNKGCQIHFATGNQNVGNQQPTNSGNNANVVGDPYVQYDAKFPYLRDYDVNWTRTKGNKQSRRFKGKSIKIWDHALQNMKKIFNNNSKQGVDIIVKCLDQYIGNEFPAEVGPSFMDGKQNCTVFSTNRDTMFAFIKTDTTTWETMLGFFPIALPEKNGPHDYEIPTFHVIGQTNDKDGSLYAYRICNNVGTWRLEVYNRLGIRHGMEEKIVRQNNQEEKNSCYKFGMFIPDYVTSFDGNKTYKVDFNTVICSSPLEAAIIAPKERVRISGATEFEFIQKINYECLIKDRNDWGEAIFEGYDENGNKVFFRISHDSLDYARSADPLKKGKIWYTLAQLEENLKNFALICRVLSKCNTNLEIYNQHVRDEYKVTNNLFSGMLENNEEQIKLYEAFVLLDSLDPMYLPKYSQIDKIIGEYMDYRKMLQKEKMQEFADKEMKAYNEYLKLPDSTESQKLADETIWRYFEFIRLYEKEVAPIDCITE